jgi:molybdopterin/thiamine biosynthesis adenylyltransferase
VAGVLGVVPGVMGMLQATEGIKVLLSLGDSLAGRLVIYDALDGSVSELQLRRDPHCPACGDGEAPMPASDGVFSFPMSPATTMEAST